MFIVLLIFYFFIKKVEKCKRKVFFLSVNPNIFFPHPNRSSDQGWSMEGGNFYLEVIISTSS